MANVEHLKRLQQGVQNWNQWRLRHPKIRPELTGATLFAAQLSGVNLSGAKLRKVRLDKADLRGANLYKADLSGAHLPDADLSGANLRKARLRGIRLRGTELSGANLSRANLPDSELSEANLSGANLSEANLNGANLNDANLTGANLSDSWLVNTQVIGTIFSKAMFTGACIKGWHPSSATILTGAICEYVYLKGFQKDRRPKTGTFKSGEFARIFQQTMGIVNLNFKDSIDWQALLQTFQILQQQCADPFLTIQAIEKRRGGAFVVRLEMSPDADTTEIKRRVKELYAIKLQALNTQYKRQLRSQEHSFEIAQIHINRERRDKATLMGILTTMAQSQQGPRYRISASGQTLSKTENSHKLDRSIHRRNSKIVTAQNVDSIQTKLIEMLLSGIPSSTISRLMHIEPGLINQYLHQSGFRAIYWRTFFNKLLDLVRLSITTLISWANDTSLTPKYHLWLVQYWIKQFSILLEDQGTPNVSVRQSEIIHLLLFGMTPKEIGAALMVDPKQILRQKRQPAFRITFWDAYCQKLLALMIKVTDTAAVLITDQQVAPNHRLVALNWLLEKFPTDFSKTLERIELERIACVLISIDRSTPPLNQRRYHNLESPCLQH